MGVYGPPCAGCEICGEYRVLDLRMVVVNGQLLRLYVCYWCAEAYAPKPK